MNQTLKIDIQADIKQMQSALSNAKKKLKDFEGGVEVSEKQVGKLGKTTQANATPALMSFGQVIADSPYGIRGVANNIEQLVAQFGYLSRSSKESGGVMKALVSGLTGPAGVLIAVSVVTSALTAMEMKGITVGDVFNKLTGTFDATTVAARKLRDESIKAQGSIQGEIALLKSLLQVAQDDNETRERRNDAVRVLQEKYPNYLKNLSVETSKTKEVETAVNSLTKALENRAKVQAATSLISEKAEEFFKKRIDLQKEEKEALDRRLADQQTAYNSYSRGITNGTFDRAKAEKTAQAEISAEFARRLANDQKEYEQFVAELGKIINETPDIYDTFGKGGSGAGTESLRVPISLTPVMEQDGFGFDDREWNLQVAEDAFTELEATSSRVLSGLQDHFNDAQEAARTFSVMSQEHARMISTAFMAMGNELADSLVDGEMSLEKFAKMMIKTVGKILTGLLAQAIGNAIVSGSQTATASGPLAAFTLPGLVAGSVGVVQGAFGAMPSFNDGGIVGGGMATGDKVLARLNSGEMVLNQSQQGNLFRALNGSNLGGSEPLEIVGESRISGDTIITAYKRAESRNNRIG